MFITEEKIQAAIDHLSNLRQFILIDPRKETVTKVIEEKFIRYKTLEGGLLAVIGDEDCPLDPCFGDEITHKWEEFAPHRLIISVLLANSDGSFSYFVATKGNEFEFVNQIWVKVDEVCTPYFQSNPK